MHGLYLLWWVQEKQLSPATVGVLLAAGDLALVFLELPTGWFADRFGHRFSLILGSGVQTIGMLWCWLGDGVGGLLIATLLVALGDAFRSGADHALLYRTCIALDREAEFQRTEGRVAAVELAALVVLVLAGGLTVHRWGFAAGWIAETALAAIGLGLACATIEPPAEDGDAHDAAVGGRAPLLSFSTLVLILPAALLGGIAAGAAFFAQTGPTSDAGTMTMMVAAITLAEAAGSAVAGHLPPAGVHAQVALALAGAAWLALAVAVPAAFLPVVCVLAALQGVAGPLRAAAVQRTADDATRARAASLANLCDMAITTVALPLAGVLR